MIPIAADARRRLEERRTALERSFNGTPQTESAMRELAETRAALDRIESGTYGRCQSCGDAIGRQRLLALPAIRLCLSCTACGR